MQTNFLQKNTAVKATKHQAGFTLMEVLVSTTIFVTVFTAMLAMFNYTLQINRRVQALREVVQGTRTFAETLTREIRNGRIDYSSTFSECNVANYASSSNQSLGIVTKAGDKLCFFFNGPVFYLRKQSASSGDTYSPVFDSSKFTINSSTFRFNVRPVTDPNPASAPYPQIQPFVTIIGQFSVNSNPTNPSTINYQTTISTDVYDIRK